jgi:hypothetical protein
MWRQIQQLKHDFTPDGIPTTLGGMWRRERFQAWLNYQKSKTLGNVRRDRHSITALPETHRRKVRQDMKRRMDTMLNKPDMNHLSTLSISAQ